MSCFTGLFDMSSNTAQPIGNTKIKRHFHLEMELELIVVNLPFNPNIQTN